MAVNPSLSLNQDEIKVRWEEPYTSDSLNARFFGFPRGVYKGFDPEVIAGAPATQLRIKIDTSQGVSVAMVRSQLASRDIQLFMTREVILDFNGTVVFPVYVKVRAQYKVGQTTTASIFTDTNPPNNFDEIGICRVRQPGGAGTDIVVDATDITVPDNRNTPVATVGQDFGFMPGGAFEDLQDALAITAEVEAARQDIDTGFIWPQLNQRLTQDFNTVANRLQRINSVLRGNIHTIPNGVLPQGFVFVSGSLSNQARAFLPARTYDVGGAPGIGGAGADGVIGVAPDNIVALRNQDTGNFFLDLTTSRPVYGRLTKSPDTISTGTSNFVNASTTVSKAAGDYVLEGVVAGQRVIAPDGNAYEVTTPITPLSFELTTSYQGANAGAINQVFELFRIDFFISDGAGGETPYVFPAGPGNINVQPYFPSFTSLLDAQRDSVLDLLHGLATVVANLCKTDGTTPFTAEQGGIDAIAGTSLTTLSQVLALLGGSNRLFAGRSTAGGDPISFNIVDVNDGYGGVPGAFITVPDTGVYIAAIACDNPVNTPLSAITLRRNGVAFSSQDSFGPPNTEPSVTCIAGFTASAGDTITITTGGGTFIPSTAERCSIFIVKVRD